MIDRHALIAQRRRQSEARERAAAAQPVLRGVIEALSAQGLSGWAASSDAQPPRLSVWVAGREHAVIAADLLREDVHAAGHSSDGRCGFEFVFPRPLPAAALASVQVTAAGGGAGSGAGSDAASAPRLPLPRAALLQRFSLHERLFNGSYAADNTVPEAAFLSMAYLRHNARRLEHLAALGLPLAGRSVIEFGAGVGDHSSFYLDRGCRVLATDARQGNLDLLLQRLAQHPRRAALRTAWVDVDVEHAALPVHDIVHCYGLLYHLAEPRTALARMARSCGELFLVETKTDPRPGAVGVQGQEDAAEVYHSASGRNFRPGVDWLAAELRGLFAHVYFALTSPSHEEFPADFADLSAVPDGWPRTVMVASRRPLDNPLLVTERPARTRPV